MFYRKKIKQLERQNKWLFIRLTYLENPLKLRVGDKVYGCRCLLSHILREINCTGRVVGVYRNSQGYPRYDVFFEDSHLEKDLPYHRIITEKPNKDEDTKA